MDDTQVAVMWTLLNGIRQAVDNNTGSNDPPDHLGDILRLVHAAESVLAGIPIEDE